MANVPRLPCEFPQLHLCRLKLGIPTYLAHLSSTANSNLLLTTDSVMDRMQTKDRDRGTYQLQKNLPLLDLALHQTSWMCQSVGQMISTANLYII